MGDRYVAKKWFGEPIPEVIEYPAGLKNLPLEEQIPWLEKLEKQLSSAPYWIRLKAIAELCEDALSSNKTSDSHRAILQQIKDFATAPEPIEGVSLRDQEFRVTYNVLFDDSEDRDIASVEVVGEPSTDPRAWRIPKAELRRQAALFQARQQLSDEIEIVSRPPTKSTDERLFELVQVGADRKLIAETLGRSVSRVDQLLREARKRRPDLPWPEVRHSPKKEAKKSKTSGNKSRHEQKNGE